MFSADQQIGPYTLVNRIGRGGFGEVWLAEKRSRIISKKVAIKLPLEEQVDFEAIRKEAVLWEKASGHPNVLPIIDADVYDGQIVIVSEYAADGSLSERLARVGRFAILPAIEMTIGILKGLEYLHEKKIIHRDIKPENVLLQEGTPRLADFGISRAMQTTAASSIAAGTIAYMSPEAFDGKRNAQTDIWSVGVLLYELVNGRLPFPQELPSERMFAVHTKEPQPMDSDVPPVLTRIVARALEKDPLKRFLSAREMLGALRRAQRELSDPLSAKMDVPLEQIDVPGPVEKPKDALRMEPVEPTEFVVEPTSSEISRSDPNDPFLGELDRPIERSKKRYLLIAIAAVIVAAGALGITALVSLRNADLSASSKRTPVPGTQEPTPTVTATPAPEATPESSPESSPTPTPVPTPIPITDRNGRYSDGYETVMITGADEKGFAVKMKIVGKGGFGELEGEAVWINPTTAVHTSIPDQESYNDPSSMSYQKKCKVTFRFSATTLKASEDSLGCMWYHGVEVTLSGTFQLKKGK